MNTQNVAQHRRDRSAQRGPPDSTPTDSRILQLAYRQLESDLACYDGAPEFRVHRVELTAGARVLRALIGWTDTQLTRAEAQSHLDARRDELAETLSRVLGARQAPSLQLLAFIPVERLLQCAERPKGTE